MKATLIPGVVSATFREKTPSEIIELCVANHLCAIEWSENAHILPDDALGAKKLAAATKQAGLAIAAYGSYYRLGEYEDAEETFCKSLVSAAALGADVMRVWAGVKPSAQIDHAERERLTLEARMIAELAAKENIRVAFEWHKNTLTDENESAMQLLSDADHPALCCLWQPTAALSMGQRIRGIDMLGSRLANFHVYYWPDGKRAPLEGGVDQWLSYFEHFKGEGTHYALLEFVKDNTVEQFARDAQVLLSLLKQGGYFNG